MWKDTSRPFARARIKNRIRTPATDFTYISERTNREIIQYKSGLSIIIFYNPDCHACQEITRQMESSFLINEFSKSNKLKILAVYPDEDLDAWKEHVSVMPKDWINSYDKSVSLKTTRSTT